MLQNLLSAAVMIVSKSIDQVAYIMTKLELFQRKIAISNQFNPYPKIMLYLEHYIIFYK